jgi:DNA-directed RNA polymerase specialized sigma24 family protein
VTDPILEGDKRIHSARELLESVDKQLSHVARSFVDATHAEGWWRIEHDDLLQIARIGAWAATLRGMDNGFEGKRLRTYCLGGARTACRDHLSKLRRKRDLLNVATSWRPLE